MAREKSIAVRFAAIGGQAVKAEMRDIGTAGRSAMQTVAGAVDPANDRLEEMARAASQARAQLEELAAKAGASANRMRAGVAAATPMQQRINTSTGVDRASAAATLAQGQALDDLRAKYNPLFATIQKYRAEVQAVRAAHADGAISASEQSTAIARLRGEALQAIDKIKGISAANREAAQAAREAAAAQADQAARLNSLRAQYNPIYRVISSYKAEVQAVRAAHADGAISASEQSTAIARLRGEALQAIDKIKGISAANREAAQAAREAAAAQADQAARLNSLRAQYNPIYRVISSYKAEVQAVRAAHADGAISASEQSTAIARLRGEALQAIDKIKGISAANREAAQAAREAAAAQADQAARLNSLRAQYNPIYRVISSYKAEVQAVRAAHADGAISANEMAAALSRLRQTSLASIAAYKGQTRAIDQMSRSASRGTHRMQQMFFQVNDIGVSLAGGQNPFLVMAQQGTQIAQIYGFGNGGVSGAFKDLGGLITKLPAPIKVVGVAVGLAALAVRRLQNDINKTSSVTVTFGDTVKAVFQVIGDKIYSSIKPALDWIGPYLSKILDALTGVIKGMFNGLINGATVAGQVMVGEFKRMFDVGKAAYTGIRDIWGQLPAAIGDFAYRAANSLIDGVEAMLNAVVQRINVFIETLNSALANLPDWVVGDEGVQIGSLSNVSFGRVDNPYAGAGNVVAGVVDDIVRAASQTNEGWANRDKTLGRDVIGDTYDAVVAAVGERAQENARNRLSRDAKKGGGRSKGSGGAATEEKRAIDELVASLQQELSVLRTTDPIKKKMLEYSDQLKGATSAERAAVQGLVEELDRAENGWEAVGRKLSEYVEQSKRLGQEWGDVFVGAFDRAADAFATFVTTGKLNFSDLIRSMAADIARLAFQEHIGGPLAGLVSGWLSGGTGDALSAALVNAGVSGVASFDGGGHTGFGPRSGGLDGKGGMMAMVHPNETVTDNTKRGHGAAQGVVVGVDPRNGNITAYVDGRIGQMLPAAFEQYSRQVLPGAIRDHMRDPRAVG